MWNVLRSLFLFRVGQKTSRGMARTFGLRSLAGVIGILGGVRYARKHSQHAAGAR
jgi:hypothetical protein